MKRMTVMMMVSSSQKPDMIAVQAVHEEAWKTRTHSSTATRMIPSSFLCRLCRPRHRPYHRRRHRHSHASYRCRLHLRLCRALSLPRFPPSRRQLHPSAEAVPPIPHPNNNPPVPVPRTPINSWCWFPTPIPPRDSKRSRWRTKHSHTPWPMPPRCGQQVFIRWPPRAPTWPTYRPCIP
jgi:hypothetical protein